MALTACGGPSPKVSAGTTSPPTTTSGSATSTSAYPTTTVPVDTAIGVYGDCSKPSVEPAEIVLTCADYGEILEGLHWSTWTASAAAAVGTLVYNDCSPDCASGHHHSVPDTAVTLTIAVPGATRKMVWSEVQESPEPPGYETGPYHGGPQPLPIRPV
jgi:hypothetical protein